MVSEYIITSLKNAVERGESLQNAMIVLVNSGYNQKEVAEASRYIRSGVTPFLQVQSEEQLIIPSETGFFSKILEKIKSKKIILLIILLVLVASLIGLILFKSVF